MEVRKRFENYKLKKLLPEKETTEYIQACLF